jgi:hypothetical protein
MTKWISQIDDTVGKGATTVADMQTNGPEYGVGIGTNLDNLGIVTAHSFVGSGASLTDVPTGIIPTVANSAGLSTLPQVDGSICVRQDTSEINYYINGSWERAQKMP